MSRILALGNYFRKPLQFCRRLLTPLDRPRTRTDDNQSIIRDFCLNGERDVSIGGESENMSRVLVGEISRGNGFKVRKAALHVVRLEHATRDHLLSMLFCFLSPFLPTLCARTGSVDAPPANRGEAKMRRSRGQIWSIRATCTVKKALIPNLLFIFFEFSSHLVGQLSTWTRSIRIYWNRMTSILNIRNETPFRRIP